MVLISLIQKNCTKSVFPLRSSFVFRACTTLILFDLPKKFVHLLCNITLSNIFHIFIPSSEKFQIPQHLSTWLGIQYKKDYISKTFRLCPLSCCGCMTCPFFIIPGWASRAIERLCTSRQTPWIMPTCRFVSVTSVQVFPYILTSLPSDRIIAIFSWT